MSRILTAVILILVLSGCKNRLDQYGEVFSELMKHPDGLFRGHHLGDSPEAVQQSEGTAPEESHTGMLSYEVRVGSSGYCSIRYGFENGHLYEIIAESAFGQESEGQQMLQGFRDYFNERYGNAENEGGFLVWSVNTAGPDHGAAIEMTDEGTYADLKSWSLSIYRHSVQDASTSTDSLLNL